VGGLDLFGPIEHEVPEFGEVLDGAGDLRAYQALRGDLASKPYRSYVRVKRDACGSENPAKLGLDMNECGQDGFLRRLFELREYAREIAIAARLEARSPDGIFSLALLLSPLKLEPTKPRRAQRSRRANELAKLSAKHQNGHDRKHRPRKGPDRTDEFGSAVQADRSLAPDSPVVPGEDYGGRTMQTREAKLRAFAKEHLLYEVEQVHALTERLLRILDHDTAAGKRDLGFLDMETRNAQVESFAIHARALLDFLYADPQGDDVSARHYVVGEWLPPPMTDSLRVVRKRVGKEIAHMTYHRVKLSVEARPWKYAAIWHDLSTALRDFTAQAASERLPKDVARRIAVLAAPEPAVPRFMHYAATATHGLFAPGATRVADGGPGTATYLPPSTPSEG
jgi:hypothetical protein